MDIKQDVQGLEGNFKKRSLNRLIGNTFENGFELDYDVASSIVLTFEPNKFRKSNKSFTILQQEQTTVLVARNADRIVEYIVEIPEDEELPPPAPEFEKSLKELIEEQKTYKRVRVGGYIVIGLFILFTIWIYELLKFIG